MKKLISALLVIAMITMSIPAAWAQETASDCVAAFLDAVDMDYAYDLTEQLSIDPAMHDNAMGFRTAGSDGEHTAAEFLASEMALIGLQDVEKIPVTVDKWQFNGASLTIADTEIDLTPVSYMVNGTEGKGITAEIVDCGTGFASDYADKDVKGKIVLVGVDQVNEAWINQYIYEAAQHGAAALVTYDEDGYGRYSDDIYQIQDVCCEDLMPTVAVTKNQGKAIAAAIAEGKNDCTLVVDSVMEIGKGVSYNVVGRIPGKSSEQQFIVSAHYDMYFTGFQDDCAAIGVIMTMAKAMIDSGVQPDNDILIIAHGAEEWAVSGTEFDWTRGAWELINTVHPEWAQKTLAMFNFELPAFDDGGDTFMISCVPELRTMTAQLVDSGVLTAAAPGYLSISNETVDTTTMEDGVSYRGAGVPYFLNVTDTCADIDTGDGYTWSQLHYHTDSDDASTYDEKTMQANIGVFGSILLTMDQTPALRLDLTESCKYLANSYDEVYAEEAGVDTKAWEKQLDALTKAAEKHQKEIDKLNDAYAKANNKKKRESLREEAKVLNAKTLAAFKMIQDSFIGIEFSSTIVQKHEGYQNNVTLLDGIIASLEVGNIFNNEGTGALDLAWMLNAACEYGYYIFTPESVPGNTDHVDAANNNFKWWAEGKAYTLAQTWPATVSLLEKSESGDTDFTDEIALYKQERASQLKYMGEVMNDEIKAMDELTELLK